MVPLPRPGRISIRKLVRFGYIAPDARETSEEAVRRAKAALSQL